MDTRTQARINTPYVTEFKAGYRDGVTDARSPISTSIVTSVQSIPENDRTAYHRGYLQGHTVESVRLHESTQQR
jgi:hypothetical protein